MNRELGLFLIVSFLGIQVLSFLHMAKFDFEKHEHSSHVCQIYLHFEHTKYGVSSTCTAIQTPKYIAFSITLPELLFVRLASYGVVSPRAPPLFS